MNLRVTATCGHCREVWVAVHQGINLLSDRLQCETMKKQYQEAFNSLLKGHEGRLSVDVVPTREMPHPPIRVDLTSAEVPLGT